jgi:hypothetical protein
MECLERVRQLCPGSRLAHEADEILEELFEESFDLSEARMRECLDSSCCEEMLRDLADTWDGLWGWAGSAVRWWANPFDGSSSAIVPVESKVEPVPAIWESGEPLDGDADRLSVLLDTRMSVHFTNVPLGAVLDDLSRCQCVPVEVDLIDLQEGAVSLIHPINLCADNVPFSMVLDQVVRQAHLACQVKDGVVRITSAPHHPQSVSSDIRLVQLTEKVAEPAPVCPRAEAMHLAAVRAEVDGLMKACHLALAEGRFEKAADLAREAHALDAERVEADPVVYKLHLLVVQEQHRKQNEEQAPRPFTYYGQRSATVNEPCSRCPAAEPPVADLDHLVREAEQAHGVVCVEQQSKGCPFAPLVAEVQDWVDHFANRHGSILIGLGVRGIEVQGQFPGEECSYNALWPWNGACFVFWKAPKTQDE